MVYENSLLYLDSFINLEKGVCNPDNSRWNIGRMQLLLDWFGHPEKSYFPVLIAGTNGKGSTGFFLESILLSSNIQTGFYSSPHLEDPLERIRINGRMISKKSLAEGLSGIRKILARHELPEGMGRLTYFEIMTLLAVLLFRKAGVRIVIFEVGMGGRLDATNVLNAKVAILTPIDLDHEAFLGNTVAKIAREKAAIIKEDADVVVSPQAGEAMRIIESQIRRTRSREWRVEPLARVKIGLLGDYQKVNALTAREAAWVLRGIHSFHSITDSSIGKGLLKKNWHGRFELFKGKPDFLLDVAHNPVAVEALVASLKKYFATRDRLLIFGVSRDKDSEKMLASLNTFFSEVILSPTASPRSQELSVLARQSHGRFQSVVSAAGIPEALAIARKRAGRNTLVVVTGSFYLVGEVRKLLRRNKTRVKETVHV